MNNLKLKVDYCVLRNILKMHIFNKLKQDLVTFYFFLEYTKTFFAFFYAFYGWKFSK